MKNEICWRAQNTVTGFKEYQEAFQRVLADVTRAQRRVWIETYCLDRSAGAAQLLEGLTEACKRKIECVLCVDFFGSFGVLPRARLREFKAAGGKVCIWNPLTRLRYSLFNRNHRKIYLIDKHAYITSGNLDARSLTWVRRRWTSWRAPDYNHTVRLDGPVVKDIESSVMKTIDKCDVPFSRHLRARRHTWHTRPLFARRQVATDGYDASKHIVVKDAPVAWLESEAWVPGVNKHKAALAGMIRNAQKTVTLASSYFQPPRFIRRALAETGASKANLVVSGVSDIVGDEWATLYCLRKHLRPLLPIDVKQTTERHLHTKTVIADGRTVALGSYNMDRYSALRNRECGVLIESPELATYFDKHVRDEVVSKPVDLSAPWRVKDAVLGCLSYALLNIF